MKDVAMCKRWEVQKWDLWRAYERLDMIKLWKTKPGIQGATDLLAAVWRQWLTGSTQEETQQTPALMAVTHQHKATHFIPTTENKEFELATSYWQLWWFYLDLLS